MPSFSELSRSCQDSDSKESQHDQLNSPKSDKHEKWHFVAHLADRPETLSNKLQGDGLLCCRFANPASAMWGSRSRTGVSSNIYRDVVWHRQRTSIQNLVQIVFIPPKIVRNQLKIELESTPNGSQVGFRRSFWAGAEGEEALMWRQIVWELIPEPTWSDLGAILVSLGTFLGNFWGWFFDAD